MEGSLHEHNTFLTLTYRDEALPDGNTLEPNHTRDFLKRLRKGNDNRLRYFLVGEYGVFLSSVCVALIVPRY